MLHLWSIAKLSPKGAVPFSVTTSDEWKYLWLTESMLLKAAVNVAQQLPNSLEKGGFSWVTSVCDSVVKLLSMDFVDDSVVLQ